MRHGPLYDFFWVRDADGTARRADSFEEWQAWIEAYYFTDRCKIAMTWITDEVRVSTRFQAVNYRSLGEGPPLIYEIMVFGGPADLTGRRASTQREAQMMHALMVAQVCGQMGVAIENVRWEEVEHVE